MTVRYTVVGGEILSELRDGVKRDYVPDPSGSTVALLDSMQTITDTFSLLALWRERGKNRHHAHAVSVCRDNGLLHR